jgi:ABC-type Fe3+/spermidine/putrescine transport system ATPase subunit/ABC-type sulfate transport system permease component
MLGITRRIATPLPWLAGLLAIYLIAPLIVGVQELYLADWSTVDTASLTRASLVSIAAASVATLTIAIGGIPLGYLLARKPGRAMACLGFLVQLPLALPPLTSGVLLLFLVGYPTPLGRLFHGSLTDSFAGIVLAATFVAAPFLIIAARSGFAAMDPVLEDVAATLGHGRLDVFWRVSLPVAWPAISAGLLLTWLRAFGEFGATVMVAYHPYSLPVYTYVAFGSQGLPAMMPVLLPTLVLAFAIMALSNIRPRNHQASITPAPLAVAPATGRPHHAAGKPISLQIRIQKRLGDFQLDVAWSPQARRLAILGPSGSGKSLTLRLLAGIEPADNIHIAIDGREIAGLEPAARTIGYVPQSYGLFPHLSVRQQLRFPVGADAHMATHWIEHLGLGGLEDRRPATLSLGQQQRVALARAFVRPARLLLMDEPFSALDAPLRARLRQEFAMLQREITATTILVTHDPAEAALLADEILVLADGKVLQSAPTPQIFRRPASETVARLLGAENAAHGVAVDACHIAIGGDTALTVAGPALEPGAHVGWSFAPARAWIAPNGPYRGVVEDAASLGVGRQVTVVIGNARIRIFDERGKVSPGDTCRFDIDPHSVQVWPLPADTAKVVSGSTAFIDADQFTADATRLCAPE